MHFRNFFSNQRQGFKPLVTYLVPKYWWSTPPPPLICNYRLMVCIVSTTSSPGRFSLALEVGRPPPKPRKIDLGTRL